MNGMLAVLAGPLERFVFARRVIGPLVQGSFRVVLKPLHQQAEIPNGWYDIFFPRTSTWALPEHRDRYLCDPGVVSFWSHGQVCRREPASNPAVDGEFFAFPDDLTEELVGLHDPGALSSGRWLWRRQAVHVGPELFARQRRLVAAIQSGCDEGWAFEAILALAGDCLRAGNEPAPSPRTARRDRELVEGIRYAISADPSRRASLATLARRAGVGQVTMCTAFRRVTGRSIHAYRLDLRLELALERLERGGDLTRIALDLGFDSHSHFSRHFRARFGASPSRLRDDLAALGRIRLKERDSAPPPRP